MSSVNRVLWELRRGTGEDREKRAGFRLGLSLVPGWRTVQQSLAAVDFNEIYDMVEPLYCADNGRPSVDPVVLFKMVLIQHL